MLLGCWYWVIRLHEQVDLHDVVNCAALDSSECHDEPTASPNGAIFRRYDTASHANGFAGKSNGRSGWERERERKKWQVSLMHLLASQNLHPENSPGLDALSAIDKPDIGEHQV